MHALSVILTLTTYPLTNDTEMRPYYLLTGLLILISVILFTTFILLQPSQDSTRFQTQPSEPPKADTDINATKSEAPLLAEDQNPPVSATSKQDSSPAPLIIELDQLKSRDDNNVSELGPIKPSTTMDSDPIEEQPVLPLKVGPKDKLLYGYEGKEEEDHKVMIGVQKGDVTIKSDIKKGDEETEVQHIEIEIKLPK